MQALDNLQVLSAVRIAMIEEDDTAGLRTLFRFGCGFALHSVNEKVAPHEEHFGEWTVDGETHHKRFFSMTHDGLQDVDALLPKLTTADFRRSDWDMAAFIKDNITGLAFAKASFAAACMGYDCPCIDILALRKGMGLSKADAEKLRGDWATWNEYITDAFLLFDGSAANQWRAYADWQATYAGSGHAIYFNSLAAALAGTLIVPPTPPTDMVARAAAKARTAAKRAATKARKDAAKAAAIAAGQ